MECGGFRAQGTLAIDPDVHGQLGCHGQEVLLKSSLHEALLLVSHQGHLLLWRLSGFQLLPELLQAAAWAATAAWAAAACTAAA